MKELICARTWILCGFKSLCCVCPFLLQDFLKEMCFTPDCKGLISKIVIFSSSGLVKCEVSMVIFYMEIIRILRG